MNTVSYKAHKRRRRKRVAFVAAAVVIVLLLFTWIFGFGGEDLKPTISYDFMADLNAPADAVPVEQHGWPKLRDGMLSLRAAAHNRFLPSQTFEPSDPELLHNLSIAAGEYHPVDPEVAASDEYRPFQLDAILNSSTYVVDVPLSPSGIRSFFLEQQATVEGMRAACALPVLGAPYDYSGVLPKDPLDRTFFYDEQAQAVLTQEPQDTSLYGQSAFNVLLPHLASLRGMSRIFTADMQLALEAGDGARATKDLIAMLYLARLSKQDSLLITQLVAASIRSTTLELMQEVFTDHSDLFSSEDLAQIAAALVAPGTVMDPLSINGEGIYIRDLVQRIYSDDGSGDGSLLIDSLREGGEYAGMDSFVQEVPSVIYAFARPVLKSMTLTRKEVIAMHEKQSELFDNAASQKPWEFDFSVYEQAHAQLMPSNPGALDRIRYFPFMMLFVRYEGVFRSNYMLAALADRIRVIVALLRYERANGMWPESLTQLVPDYLAAVPLDPADGAPLRYDVREGRPLLWSIGHDRIDNDGRSPVEFTDEVEDESLAIDNDEAAQVKFGDLSPALVTGDDWILWRGPRAP